MASKTWLAVILCTVIWFGYIQFFAPPPPAPGASSSTSPSSESGESVASQEGATAPAGQVAGGASGWRALPPFAPADQWLTLKNDLQTARFDPATGSLVQLDLGQYHETVDENSPSIQVINPRTTPFAFQLLYQGQQLAGLNRTSREAQVLGDQVIFTALLPNGVKEVRQYTLKPGSYFVDFALQLEVPETVQLDPSTALKFALGGSNLEVDSSDPLKTWEWVAYQNDSLERTSLDEIESGQVARGKTGWVSMGNKYFAAVAVPRSGVLNPDVVQHRGEAFRGGFLSYPLGELKGTGRREWSFDLALFGGPKELDILAKVPGLSGLIDYGFFSVVAYPLLYVLQWFYSFLHNYGLAIILLTILVRVAFFPLTIQSMRSMKAMQKLQPEIQALKEKYGNDQQRMGQEQMALFKKHKVNPLGGCLPLLVQFPVFIALYAVLGNSIELFHAPFFGWLQDLSGKDPLYITPVLMGVTMFLQQYFTPAAGMDPTQRKMLMFILPGVFTFVALNFPSGLNLYIFVSTLLGIVQQVLVNKSSDAKVSGGAATASARVT